MDVRCAEVEQASQVAAQQLPGEEVGLVAVFAVNDEAADAAWLEQRLERVDVLQILEQILPLVIGQRLVRAAVIVPQLGSRIRRVARERVLGRVVSHVSTL